MHRELDMAIIFLIKAADLSDQRRGLGGFDGDGSRLPVQGWRNQRTAKAVRRF